MAALLHRVAITISQAHSYLPIFSWYQIILLGERHSGIEEPT